MKYPNSKCIYSNKLKLHPLSLLFCVPMGMLVAVVVELGKKINLGLLLNCGHKKKLKLV